MAAVQIAPGGTFLGTMKKTFPQVTVDAANGNAISTEEFLDAAEALTTMFGISYPLFHP